MFQGIQYLFRIVYKLEKKYIVALLLMELFQVVLVLSNILFPKYILDFLFGAERSYRMAVVYMILYTVVSATMNIAAAYTKYQSEKSRDSLYTKYSIWQGRKLLKCSYEKLEDPQFLDLREKAEKYINAYGFAGIIPVSTMNIGRLVSVMMLVSVIIVYDYRIFLIYLLLSFLNLLFNVYNKKKIIKEDLSKTEAERRRAYIKEIFETPQYAKEMRTFSMVNWLLDKYRKAAQQVNGYEKKKNRFLCKNKMAYTLFGLLQQIITYGYLIYCTMTGEVSVGNFTMYLSGIITFNHLILEVFNSITDLKQYDMYFSKFKQFDTYLEFNEQNGCELYSEMKYMIEFCNVSFRYPGQEQYALKNINLEMSSGEKICIVGENGAGKTTLLKLLLRLYHTNEGEIRLNGVNIQKIRYEDYMKIFAVLFQDFQLFSDSVRNNIILNDTASSGGKLEKAIKQSGVDTVLEQRERDANVSVSKMFDEQGIEFSGGERQKIALARALYKDAPILLLDEPSSALDPISEADQLRQFDIMSQGKLALFISHRLASAKKCGRILVFEGGRIVEDGDHEALMTEKGKYYELYQAQVGLYHTEGLYD